MKDLPFLEAQKSMSTTLISYYLKGGTNVGIPRTHIAKELSSAENIKSESTKKEVISGLRAIQRNLKEFSVIPEKGIAIFSGNGYYL